MLHRGWAPRLNDLSRVINCCTVGEAARVETGSPEAVPLRDASRKVYIPKLDAFQSLFSGTTLLLASVPVQ